MKWKRGVSMRLILKKKYGFAQLNANTYVSPYHQHQEVLEPIKKYDLSDGIVELYGEMKIHKDLGIFLNEIFTINNLNEQYEQFIDKYKVYEKIRFPSSVIVTESLGTFDLSLSRLIYLSLRS